MYKFYLLLKRSALVLVAMVMGSCHHSASNAVQAWTLLGPDGTLVIRMISQDGTCPNLNIGIQEIPMQPRPLLDPADFPITICETTLASAPASASIGETIVPLPAAHITRIAVVGDTGCRLKDGEPIQSCNDPNAWPLRRVMSSISAWQPDLVIHVGDYHYREMDCPAGNDGCAGSITGDNWGSWNQDFFSQVEPLLSSVPWIFIRGNHEICKRAGRGWFNFLDSRAAPSDCAEFTDPYVISLGDWKLLILDSSASIDDEAKPDMVATYQAQLATLFSQAGDHAWLVDHHPIWGIVEHQKSNDEESIHFRSATLQAAAKGQLPSGLHKILSGHIHAFQTLDFGDAPSQLIVGNGGTELQDPMPSVTGETIDDRTVKTSQTVTNFGFLTMEITGQQITAQLRDENGNIVKNCRPAGAFNCEFY